MEQEASHNDILGAINEFSTKVEERFDKVENRLDKIEGRVGKLEAGMVTKDYLDSKLADLRGDLVALTRKEDTKLVNLVEILDKRKLIAPEETKRILSMEPFAKMYV